MKPRSGLCFEGLLLVLFPGNQDGFDPLNPSCCRNAKKYYEKKDPAEQDDAVNPKLPKGKNKEPEKEPKKNKKDKKSKKKQVVFWG